MARILVAEDDNDVRVLLRFILERDGHSVEATRDGIQALAAYRAGSFDVVCSDLEMPRLNGIELTLAIRCSARADVPILMITGSASHRDLEDARVAGVTDLLHKPFRPPAFRDRVAALLPAAGAPA